MQPTADIALIGLAVMGQNLILNMNDHGFKVIAYNRTVSKVDEFLNKEAKGTNVTGAHSIEEMVSGLKRPRRVMMLVKADRRWTNSLSSSFRTWNRRHHNRWRQFAVSGHIRRTRHVESKGLLYIGTGSLRGRRGATWPIIMPGGSPPAWPHVKGIFQEIAAKVEDGRLAAIGGRNGAGHYVKMVHNGIEYGDMQVICEAYQLMKDGLE